eukprot:3325186-Pyramimonas_sp.AAC.1
MLRESAHTMIPVGETGLTCRFACSVCCSVISTNSHGNRASQDVLATPCVSAQPRAGIEGARSLFQCVHRCPLC